MNSLFTIPLYSHFSDPNHCMMKALYEECIGYLLALFVMNLHLFLFPHLNGEK